MLLFDLLREISNNSILATEYLNHPIKLESAARISSLNLIVYRSMLPSYRDHIDHSKIVSAQTHTDIEQIRFQLETSINELSVSQRDILYAIRYDRQSIESIANNKNQSEESVSNDFQSAVKHLMVPSEADKQLLESPHFNQIVLFLSRSLIDDEIESLNSWREESVEHEQFFFQVYTTWLDLGVVMDTNEIQVNLSRVRGKLEEVQETVTLPHKRKRTNLLLGLLLVLATASVYLALHFNSAQKIIEQSGKDASIIVLEDGTCIEPAENCTIAYPEHFASGIRKISLNGEARVKVASDPQRLFVIELENGRLETDAAELEVIHSPTGDSTIINVSTGTVILSRKKGEEELALKDVTIGIIDGNGDVYPSQSIPSKTLPE